MCFWQIHFGKYSFGRYTLGKKIFKKHLKILFWKYILRKDTFVNIFIFLKEYIKSTISFLPFSGACILYQIIDFPPKE